jgi:hypothetical protein
MSMEPGHYVPPNIYNIKNTIINSGNEKLIQEENKETVPSKIHDSYWIYEKNDKFDKLSFDGKWMLFFDKKIIDEKWRLLKQLYNDGKLIGIHSVKVSTAKDNPRATNQKTGVIIAYCGIEIFLNNINLLSIKVQQMMRKM